MADTNRDTPRSVRRRGVLLWTLLGTSLTGTLTATTLVAAPAAAHATVQLYGSEPSAGEYGHLFLRIPHGCDGGKATDTVTVTIPTGFTSVKPERKDGWKTRIGRNEKGRVTSITWYDGNLPDNHFEDFGLSVKYPAKPGTYHLPTVQRCGAANVAWEQTAKPGQSPHALERPAPNVVVEAVDHRHGTTGTDIGKAIGKGIGKAIGKGIGRTAGEKDQGRAERRGEAVVFSFNGRTTLVADLPSTLRGRIATVTLETSTETTVERTLLERTLIEQSGDLQRSYLNVTPDGRRITHGSMIVVTVAGQEMVRVVVPATKKQ